MGLSKKISDVYAYPLPYKVTPLPPLIPHNPVSVVYFLYVYFFQAHQIQVVHQGHLDLDDPTRAIKVRDAGSMQALWQMGFFGKGTLSRSEPSWFGRTARRLGLDGGELSLEEVTEQRRALRRQFKKDREITERRELNAKRALEGLHPLPDIENKPAPEKGPEPLRAEDSDIIVGNTIQRLEYLQLTPSEALFLVTALSVVEISASRGGDSKASKLDLGSLVHHLFAGDIQNVREYVVYHYFRSLGWCVRGGVKFGTDFLLYRRGPPFHHAEFTIMVVGSDERRDWQWQQQTMRVVSGVKKALVIVYVDGPGIDAWDSVGSLYDFRNILSQYTVKPLVFTRWSPNRTRD